LTKWTAESVLAELQPIFEEILDEPELLVTRSSDAWNTPNWDSLAHIDLVEAVEHHFKVKFSLNELKQFKTVGELVDLILAANSQL
jgi:acyl carrier protein